MAEEPIWFLPKGSSISFRFASRRMSPAILYSDAAMPDSTVRM